MSSGDQIIKRLNRKPSGFTIIELLVVIVVIGILTSIGVISYSGISQKARAKTLESDLISASLQLEQYHSFHGVYPDSLDTDNCPVPADTNYCLKISGDNSYTSYFSDGKSFGLAETNTNGMVYSITDSTAVAAGTIAMYTLTISAGSNGTVNTAINRSYVSGSTPTITATPSSGYRFSSWTGDTGCSGIASHTITMNAAKSCTANFVIISPYIQTITAASCPLTRTQVQDARDGHTYWIQKLADNKCWMLTNLGYAGSGTNTYSDTKTLTNGTGGSMTVTVASYYVIPSTTNFTTEPTAPSTSTNGTGQYGYLYNWCAAMGGQATTACTNAATPTPDPNINICPSGWRLPTSDGGEFTALNTAINGGSTTTDAGLIGTPWLAQRGGGFWSDIYGNLGSSGYYWSSTQADAYNANTLAFSSNLANPANHNTKSMGSAVRCVAV